LEKKYELVKRIRESINNVFVGKEDVVELVLICLLSGGHVLLEDVPGVGKTTLAKTLAKTIGCTMGRVQFTPDTMPSDIVGMSIYNMKTGEFEHRDGVIMNQIVLADEINRTSPKTQASLLEAMAEGQVTVDGEIYPLPELFMVIATQNPVEFLGTYPLPEAQMDRFMMRLSIGYQERNQEIRMAKQFLTGKTVESLNSVCTCEEIKELVQEVVQVEVKDPIIGYVEDMVELTRQEKAFVYGVSPRGMLALLRAAQAKAFLEQRNYVKPDDVKGVAKAVLLHRLILTGEARMRKTDAEALLHSIIIKTKVPV